MRVGLKVQEQHLGEEEEGKFTVAIIGEGPHKSVPGEGAGMGFRERREKVEFEDAGMQSGERCVWKTAVTWCLFGSWFEG